MPIVGLNRQSFGRSQDVFSGLDLQKNFHDSDLFHLVSLVGLKVYSVRF